MISNVNIGTTITTVLQPPANSRYAVHFVHFCNTSDSDSEVLTIYLSHNPVSVSTVIKEVTVPPGETFVFGTSRNLSNVVKHLRVRDNQVTYLASHELLAASSSGTNIVATANYAEITIDKTQELVQPTPTPTPSNSYNLTRKEVCGCNYNTNDAWQQTAFSATGTGARWFYIHYNDVASPHSNALGGSTIFKVGQCIYYNGTSNGQPVIHWNKVTEVFGPFYMSNTAYYKIHLEEIAQAEVPAGEKIYVCDSVNPDFSPTPTPSVTPSITITPVITPSTSITPSTTPSVSPSTSITPSITPSRTASPTISVTPTTTPSITVTPSVSPSTGTSPTPSISKSATPSVTPSISVTPSPSVTPSTSIPASVTPSITPSTSTLNTQTAEYCKPYQATIFNIAAFVPHGLQANGIYDFDTGSISTLSNSARNFKAAQISNYIWASALFKFEMVSEDDQTNLQTWRWTFTNWPKADGSLVGITPSVSDPSWFTSEATKSKSSKLLRFNFGANGAVIVTFKNDDCSNISNNNCSNLEKPEHYYMYDKYLLSITNPKSVNKDLKINSGITYGGESQNRPYGGWGQIQGGSINTDGYQHRQPSTIAFEEFIAEEDASLEITEITTELVGKHAGQTEIGNSKIVIPPQYFMGNFSVQTGRAMHVVRAMKTSSDIEFRYPYTIGNTLTFVPQKTRYGGGPCNGSANCQYYFKFDVKKGDRVFISAALNFGYNDSIAAVPNGAKCQLTIKQRRPESQSSADNILREFGTVNGDPVGTALSKMSETQATNYIKSILAAHGVQYNTAVNQYITHLGGTEEYILALASGNSAYSVYTFQDLFFINSSTLNVGDTVDNIYRFPRNNFRILSRNIQGRVEAKVGNLYALSWSTDNPNEYNKRLLDTAESDWAFINYGVCTENIFVNPPASPAPMPTPSPTPSPSPVTVLAEVGLAAKNNPLALRATNIGPWTGNRPGYTCPTGGTYGNGYFMWPLANPRGSFPYWSGPLFEMRCLSAADSPIQTWQFIGKGWNYCQGPNYTTTGTKAYHEDSVTFTMGAGTLTVYFKE